LPNQEFRLTSTAVSRLDGVPKLLDRLIDDLNRVAADHRGWNPPVIGDGPNESALPLRKS